jgi:hypothetical protein
MDNNMSAIPSEFKEFIVGRYLTEGIRTVDINSGFEPKGIDEYTIRLFDRLPLRWWRIGFDEIGEEKQVTEAIRIIQSISKKKIRVYTMIGGEPIEQCRHRCEKTIELGCEPVPQAFIAKTAKEKKPSVLHDWTAEKLSDFPAIFLQPSTLAQIKIGRLCATGSTKTSFRMMTRKDLERLAGGREDQRIPGKEHATRQRSETIKIRL